MRSSGHPPSSGTSLIKNTYLYFIGSLSSKLLNFLLLPFITAVLTVEEYGYYDFIQTIISLALPIFTLQAIEAAFRFLYDADETEKEKVLTNVWVILIGGAMLFSISLLLIDRFIAPVLYVNQIILYYITHAIFNMYQRIARSFGYNKAFAVSGVMQTVFLLIFQLGCLYLLHLKTEGLVYSYAASSILACVYLEMKIRSASKLRTSAISRESMKSIILFSAPLIINSISWWATASVNRILILFFIGAGANGIFSIASKFASIVTMVTSVFQLSWQEYCITEYGKEGYQKRFSEVFNNYAVLLIYLTVLGTLFQRVFLKYIVAADFMEALLYIPIVMLGVAFSSLSSFYGAGYLACKKTSGAFKTTVLSAVINVILCVGLIPFLGLYGAAASTAGAYFLLVVVRHISMKPYFPLTIQRTLILEGFVVTAISFTAYYIGDPIVSIALILLLSLLFLYKRGDFVRRLLRKKLV